MGNFTVRKTAIWIFVLCLIGFSSSCRERDNPVIIQLTLDRAEVSGEEAEQFLHLNIDSDKDWTITVYPGEDWCFVSQTSGTGEAWIVVTTAENGDEYRTATITATSGRSSISVEVTQQPMSLIDVFGNTNFPNAGATRTLQVRTRLPWTASITEGNSFSRLGTPTSGTGNGTIDVTFDPNTDATTRSANLRVTVSGEEINLTLNQGIYTVRPKQDIPFRIELPEVRNRRWFVDHTYLALEFDTAQRHSVWVAFVFNNALRQRNVSRSDRWRHDPIIPVQYQWAYPVTRNHRGDITIPSFTVAGAFDRGHIVASEDRVFNLLSNWETFYTSNISPQFSRFNQRGGLWFNLEIRVREWAANFDTLYVVKGAAINQAGTIYTVNGQEHVFEGVETLGTIAARNNVTIARYWFMAMVGRNGDTFTGIAFWMENNPNSRGQPSQTHAVTIRELEHLTGINFFPNLGIAFPAIYDFVETNIDFSRWPGL